MALEQNGSQRPSVPKGFAWQAVEWKRYISEAEIDDRRLRYIDIGDGPAILLVHGLGGNWKFWLENICDLCSEHRVIAVDLPGFGESDCLRAQVTMRGFADVLAKLLATLDISQVTIVGHSMGGIVVAYFALKYPDAVRGFVLAGSGGLRLSAWRRVCLLAAALTINSVLRLKPLGSRIVRLDAVRRFALGRIVSDPSCVSADLIDQMTEGFGSRGFAPAIKAAINEDLQDELPNIRRPALLVYGDGDPLASPGYAAKLANLIPGSRLVILNHVGHAPMIEQRDIFNQLILDFAGDDACRAPTA